MNLLNLAEIVDASRSLDEYENKKIINNKNIFIEEIFEKLFKNRKISNNKIYNFAKNLKMAVLRLQVNFYKNADISETNTH